MRHAEVQPVWDAITCQGMHDVLMTGAVLCASLQAAPVGEEVWVLNTSKMDMRDSGI